MVEVVTYIFRLGLREGGGGWVVEINLPGSVSSVATLLCFSAGPAELAGARGHWGGRDLFRQYSARPDLNIMFCTS